MAADHTIKMTTDPEDDDAETPILVCSSPDIPRTKIMLLEETSYELKIVPEDGVDISDEFADIRLNCDDAVLKSSCLSNERLYELRFNGYVGKGVFDTYIDGERFAIPFEVRSRKLNYRTEYPRMLSDIAEFSTALLLSVKSPLYSHYTISEERAESKYEEFLILEYVFDRLEFAKSYEEVRRNRHCELVSESKRVPACLAHSVGPSSLTSMARGRNLAAADDGPVLGKYAPIWVDEPRAYDSYDTPENRLVKETVLAVQASAERLRRDLGGGCSDYVRDRLAEMCHTSGMFASDEWLSDIGEMHVVPFDSLVLANRGGYAEIFSAYLILGMNALLNQGDTTELLKGRGNKVHLVYEYWCYTRLYKCLDAISSKHQKLPIVKTSGGWEVSIKGGSPVSFEVPCYKGNLNVDLYYNRRFKNDGTEMSSYSVNLRPDFTLAVSSPSDPNRMHLVHFDAKYKAKWKDKKDTVFEESKLERGCWEYDIYKMHTYRDALLRSYGSYVLYPGEVPETYRKNVTGHGKLLPSVGAVRLVPGEDVSDLDMVLKAVFEDICGITSGEILLQDLRRTLSDLNKCSEY